MPFLSSPYNHKSGFSLSSYPLLQPALVLELKLSALIMGKHSCLLLYSLVSLAWIGSHASVSSDAWKLMMPNTLIPDQPLKDNFPAASGSSKKECKFDTTKENDDIVNLFFFLEKDLHIGTKLKLEFKRGSKKAPFLPLEAANTIPFSSQELQEVVQLLSLEPNSEKAYIMLRRIKLCEEPTIPGVEKQCFTSLESMVDYVTSKLGKDVKPISTKVEKDVKMEYSIEGINKLGNDDNEAIMCHKMEYPFVVYFCHKTNTITSYMVTLIGEDGSKLEAVAACHKEINAFLESYEVNVLKVKPGISNICHFQWTEDSIIWVRK